jgi:hypothetical protein
MRTGMLGAFLAGSFGYMALSRAPSSALACAAVAVAHGGGSVVWVFSTTLLQQCSDNRFHGRVFAADLGFFMLAIAVAAALADILIDNGVSVRVIAFSTGVAMLAPALVWFRAMRLWRDAPPSSAGGGSRIDSGR